MIDLKLKELKAKFVAAEAAYNRADDNATKFNDIAAEAAVNADIAETAAKAAWEGFTEALSSLNEYKKKTQDKP